MHAVRAADLHGVTELQRAARQNGGQLFQAAQQNRRGLLELKRLCVADGHVLVFNCHISRQAGRTIAFPDDAQAANFEGLARELFEMSSPLPEPMRQQALAKGYQTGPGARGYAFNADLVTLIDFLDIGTRVIQDRLEAA